MSEVDAKPDKGGRAEELLRLYFADQGYFVVRSVAFRYGNDDVTDLDLMLYARFSASSKERVVVDVKQKKTPQALERILCVLGLQRVLGFDAAIVATTDRRPMTAEFGRENGVLVLGGEVLASITNRSLPASSLTEESFVSSLRGSEIRHVLDLNEEYQRSKSILLEPPNFDCVNRQLSITRSVLEQTIVFVNDGAAIRCLYATVACLLISIDMALSVWVFEPRHEQRRRILDGVRFGSAGRQRIESIVGLVGRLGSRPDSPFPKVAQSLRAALADAADGIPADMLAEYFSRPESSQQMFTNARKLLARSFEVPLVRPAALESELKAVLGVLCDFYGFRREDVLANSTP